MDWSAWELARSTLDESVKNSVGLLLYADKISGLGSDPIRGRISSFDPKYISSFTVATLYFCHLQAVLGGLALAGMIVRNGRFLVRDDKHSPRWNCVNESWIPDWSRTLSPMSHTKILEQYDSIQKHQAKWLPSRDIVLRKLKKVREAVTYHTARMGGWSEKDTLHETLQLVPTHIDFQRTIVECVC